MRDWNFIGGGKLRKPGNDSVIYKDFYYQTEPRNQLSQSDYNSEDDISLFENIVDALQKGNELTLKNNQLTIRKGNDIIAVFQKPKHLLWKIIDFSH